MTMNIRDASVYTDLSGLNAISQLGREDSAAALREVAVQFESIFLNMMLKGMRAGEDVLFSENLLRSNEMTFHRENLDNQLSMHMASNGGIGLADALHRQLLQRYEKSSETSAIFAGDLSKARRFGGQARSAVNARPVTLANFNLSADSSANANLSTDSASRPLTPTQPGRSRAMPAHAAATFNSPQEFVERLLPLARQVAPQLGVDPRVLLAQSALETGWGQKMITGADGQPSHNLFGIKAGAGWQGERVSVSTLESRDGVMVREQASFRSYDSFEDSLRDYVQLLRSQPRYAPALQHAANPEAFGYHLQKAGYATDPQYAEKIGRVLRSPAMSDALRNAMPAAAGVN